MNSLPFLLFISLANRAQTHHPIFPTLLFPVSRKSGQILTACEVMVLRGEPTTFSFWGQHNFICILDTYSYTHRCQYHTIEYHHNRNSFYSRRGQLQKATICQKYREQLTMEWDSQTDISTTRVLHSRLKEHLRRKSRNVRIKGCDIYYEIVPSRDDKKLRQ